MYRKRGFSASQIAEEVGLSKQAVLSRLRDVVDKIAASHRFGSGNTRMKDYDDLWRLAQSGKKVNLAQVENRLTETGIPMTMESRWINPETKELWKRHIRRY